jgi:hypothetical protein
MAVSTSVSVHQTPTTASALRDSYWRRMARAAEVSILHTPTKYNNVNTLTSKMVLSPHLNNPFWKTKVLFKAKGST